MDLKDASTPKELPSYSIFISKQITHFKLKSTITMPLARMVTHFAKTTKSRLILFHQ